VGAYPGGRPDFTVGALVSDTFARYGAAVARLIVVAAVASILSWLGSLGSVPTGARNPFQQPSGSDAGGLLSLLGFIAGIITSSAMFAIADSDGSVPFRRVLRRAINRAGWVFLASIILVAVLIVLVLVGVIVAALFAIISPPLAIIPVIVLIPAFIWMSARLMLGLPAIVADGYDSIQALKLSWRITRPTGVWLRMFGASLVLGLLVAPGALGAILLFFPAFFSPQPQVALLLVPALSGALLTPLTALIAYSAYRRLVVPHSPRWTAVPTLPSSSPQPTSTDAPPPTPASADEPALPPIPVAPEAAPLFSVPRFGTAAKALLALVVAFDVAGIAAIPYGFTRMEAFIREGLPGFPRTPGSPGFPGFPGFPGAGGGVPPGTVAFGFDVDLDTCTIGEPLFIATASTEVEWIATPDTTVKAEDEVFLRVTRDGRELSRTLQESGTYECLGSETGVPGLVDGIYTYEILVNGSVEATGSLFVQ
jgi:hypothetical protein